MKYPVEMPMPPGIFKSTVSGKTYAVGGKWVEIPEAQPAKSCTSTLFTRSLSSISRPGRSLLRAAQHTQSHESTIATHAIVQDSSSAENANTHNKSGVNNEKDEQADCL